MVILICINGLILQIKRKDQWVWHLDNIAINSVLGVKSKPDCNRFQRQHGKVKSSPGISGTVPKGTGCQHPFEDNCECSVL